MMSTVTVFGRHCRQVVQRIAAFLEVGVIDQIGYPQDLPGVVAADRMIRGIRFGVDDFADRVDDESDFFDLVFRRFAGVHVRDVQDRLLVQIEDFTDRLGVAALVEVVPDAQRFQMLVAVELVVVVERDRK